jgi:hypothetical protein
MKTKFFFLTMIAACLAMTAKAGLYYDGMFFSPFDQDDSYYYLDWWGVENNEAGILKIPAQFPTPQEWQQWGEVPLISIVNRIGVNYSDSRGYTWIKKVEIPTTVNAIGANAFKDCTGIEDVYVFWTDPTSVTMSETVFSGITTSAVTLHVPVGAKAAYQAAAQWQDFNIVDDGAEIKVAKLASLTISNETLSPEFSPSKFNYEVTVSKSVSTITITATPRANEIISGDLGQHALAIGKNTFKITATLPDNSASNTYTVTVTRLGDCEYISGRNYSTRTFGFTNPKTGNFMYIDNQRILTFMLSTNEYSGSHNFLFTFGTSTETRTANIMPNSLYEVIVTFDVIRQYDYGDAVLHTYYNTYGQLSSASIEYPNSGSFSVAVAIDDNTIFSGTDNFLARPKEIASVEFTYKSSSAIENIATPRISVYPNPVKDVLHIDFPSFEKMEYLTITDLSGRTVETLRAPSLQNGTATINVSNLSKGIYILKVGDYRTKFVRE